MAKGYYLGVDVGGTKIAAGLVHPGGKIVAWEKTSTPRRGGAAEVARVILRAARDVLRDAGVKPKRLKGIGVGVPGIVDADGEKVLVAPNIALAGYPLAAELRRRFDTKVALGNDVNLGVLGERWLGAGEGLDDVVGIFPGTGVGGGVVCGGKLLTGAHGAAAELGHVVLDPKGPLCGCGARGCLEAYSSRTAVERDIRAGVKAGARTDILLLNGGKLDVIKSKVLARALKRRDPLVTSVLRAASERLGDACVSLRHCFDPELFLFGGGLVEACGEFMLPIVRRRLAQDALFRTVGACKVARSRLGDDAVVLGAVALAKRA
ncbi:MAG: ROK family protein [Elusimicrobia bacterium]|nr:ROK family protein [Elusimicrobiota bacterium]MDE2510914.1 ROK family protein [Elusimicrobiota bacterium]